MIAGIDRSEVGTALIEMVVVGFVAVVLLVPTIAAAVRLADAHGVVSGTASDAATWYARHGEHLDVNADGVDTSYLVSDGSVEVIATTRVEVVSVLGARITVGVSDRATAAVSPYRSAPRRSGP